jgi:hypothetical protein
VALAALALLALFAVLVAAAVSDDVRRRLGFESADPLVLAPCTPEPGQVRRPAGDPPPGAWRTEPRLPAARDELRAAAVGGRVLVGGGHDRADDGRLESAGALYTFDPMAGRFTRSGELPVALDHTEVVEHRGDVYVVGGFSNYVARGEVWRYSPRRGRWTMAARLPLPRGGHGAGWIGDRLYVAVGAPPTLPDPDVRPYASLQVYDAGTGRWSEGPDAPTARHHVGGTVLGGSLYVVGGRNAADFSLAALERFDPDRGSWEALAPLPQGAGGLAAVAVGGKLVVAGGGDDRERWVTPAAWSYDPAADRWERLPDLRTARHGHAIAAVGRRVYVLGGSPCPGFGRTSSVESLEIR